MATRSLPQTFRKIVVRQLSPKFHEATEIVNCPMLQPGPGQILVKNKFVGINASDINFSAGRYSRADAGGVKLPFDIGFEGVGRVISLGSDCTRFTPGQFLCYTQYGSFAEYVTIHEKKAVPLSSPNPEYLPLLVSGLTAAISLDRLGELKTGDKVLVTAAAGGTGQFSVQWAKHAGCHVIGVTSSQDKVNFLKSIGCDRVINYNEEDLKSVLRTEYPKGVDVVYESIGGQMFETCVNALSVKGRLIIIGYISGYDTSTGLQDLSLKTPNLVRRLLAGSASIRGFFLEHYPEDFKKYLMRLIEMYDQGKLKSAVDLGSKEKKFHGLDNVGDAVNYLYSKKNIGKVVVELDE